VARVARLAPLLAALAGLACADAPRPFAAARRPARILNAARFFRIDGAE
jgi:hypothetical protein